jgi:hypothetical protein
MSYLRRLTLLPIAILLLLSTSAPVFAINVNLIWDPNTEPNLVGYKLYIGAASRTYGVNVPLGNVTTAALTGLTPGTYYFAVTALDSLGNESAYSNEFSATLACTSSISSSSQSFTSSAVLGSVSVTVLSGCNWTATSNASFITVTSGSSGSGNGTVSYSVAPNTGASQRTGTITIAGQTFTVTQDGLPQTTLVVTPETVSAGGAVTATWANIASPTATDWIGLYASAGAADNSYLSWRYTNGLASSNVPFTMPVGAPTGAGYELRLFNNWVRRATSNSFTIQGTTLAASPTLVSAGGEVTATWTNIASPSATDWIGLYPSTGAADSAYLSWRYTNGQAGGNVGFTIPPGTAEGSTYVLRLYGSGGRLATSNTFTIQATTLTVSPTTVSAGGSVIVTWANIASPSATDWIGLYSSSGAVNSAYLSWRYTDGQAGGIVGFTIPEGTAAGSTYVLRLYGSGGRLATSNTFTIQATTLTLSPTTVDAGGR